VLALEWSKQAANDLETIRLYIDQFNPKAATDLYDEIMAAAEILPFMPLAFRVGLVVGTREYLAHKNYILVYKVYSAKVRILRVMHVKRQYP